MKKSKSLGASLIEVASAGLLDSNRKQQEDEEPREDSNAMEDISEEDQREDEPPKLPKGKRILDVTVSTDVDALYRSVFDPDGSFFEIICRRCYEELKNFSCGQWATSGRSGRPEREMCYEIAKYIAFSRQVVSVRQSQVVAPYTRRGRVYGVDTATRNSGVMYADYFVIHIHFRMTAVATTRARMEVVADVEFIKPCLFRGRIESETWSGLKKYYEMVEQEVQTERDIGASTEEAAPTAETAPVSKNLKEDFNRSRRALDLPTVAHVIPGENVFTFPLSLAVVLLMLVILFFLTLATFKLTWALGALEERVETLEAALRTTRRVLAQQQQLLRKEEL